MSRGEIPWDEWCVENPTFSFQNGKLRLTANPKGQAGARPMSSGIPLESNDTVRVEGMLCQARQSSRGFLWWLRKNRLENDCFLGPDNELYCHYQDVSSVLIHYFAITTTEWNRLAICKVCANYVSQQPRCNQWRYGRWRRQMKQRHGEWKWRKNKKSQCFAVQGMTFNHRPKLKRKDGHWEMTELGYRLCELEGLVKQQER